MRLPVYRKPPRFTKSRPRIDELVDGGIGKFLTEASRSDLFDTPTLRVTAHHLLRGGDSNLYVDDRINHLTRALDALFSLLGSSGVVNSLDTLEDAQKSKIRKIYKHAGLAMNRLSEESYANNQVNMGDICAAISRRIYNSVHAEVGFRVKLASLLTAEQFYDAEVGQAHFDAHPRDDGRDWFGVVNELRNQVTHDGYLNTDRMHTAVDDAFMIVRHLQDIVLRVLLRRLGYSGKYQPIPLKFSEELELDWVRGDTVPELLGYRGPNH